MRRQRIDNQQPQISMKGELDDWRIGIEYQILLIFF